MTKARPLLMAVQNVAEGPFNMQEYLYVYIKIRLEIFDPHESKRLESVMPRKTSSYPGWIKSPHVVTLGILKILDLNSLTIFGCGGGVFRSKLWSSQI